LREGVMTVTVALHRLDDEDPIYVERETACPPKFIGWCGRLFEIRYRGQSLGVRFVHYAEVPAVDFASIANR
jgi:hypothetical protein